MQNNAPIPAGQPGGAPDDPKLAKQRKKEEAERQKKIQQEKKSMDYRIQQEDRVVML